MRARLLRESELSLVLCIDICRAAEISSAHLKVLTEEKVVHVVNSSEQPDKSAIKKEEKEYTRAGMAGCLLYTSPSPRDLSTSRMPSSA